MRTRRLLPAPACSRVRRSRSGARPRRAARERPAGQRPRRSATAACGASCSEVFRSACRTRRRVRSPRPITTSRSRRNRSSRTRRCSPRSSAQAYAPGFAAARSRRPAACGERPAEHEQLRQGGRGIAVIAARRLDSYTARGDGDELARRVRVGSASVAAPELEPRRHDAALAGRALAGRRPLTPTRPRAGALGRLRQRRQRPPRGVRAPRRHDRAVLRHRRMTRMKTRSSRAPLLSARAASRPSRSRGTALALAPAGTQAGRPPGAAGAHREQQNTKRQPCGVRTAGRSAGHRDRRTSCERQPAQAKPWARRRSRRRSRRSSRERDPRTCSRTG